jgi:urocanate hydratase
MGMSFIDAINLRHKNPKEYIEKSKRTITAHVTAMLELQKKGAITFDYGNNIRGEAKDNGVENAFDIPGFCSGIYPSPFLRRQRPVPMGGAYPAIRKIFM